MDLFTADGSYDEGISYARYSTLHLVQAIDVLARHRGLDLYDNLNWRGFVDYACGLTLPTRDDPYAVVNFGDAGTGMDSDVPFWVASRAGDARAQWFGKAMARASTPWALIWYDGALDPIPPPDRPTVWHSDLDWIVARSGYAADDLVVAMRSGGPSNHEHADRNSVIVKAFGEVLVADPYRPPYSSGTPAWMMRTTAGHSALLIDGEGHQYHQGEEGTNASDAAARIVRRGERDGYAFWASDATPAYRLVLPHVTSVTRSVYVLYDLPAVVLLDKVTTDGTPVRLQARHFGDNRDDACRITADGATFELTRPYATLHATGLGPLPVTAQPGRLPIPEDRARQHPFADLATDEAATAPLLITVLRPVPDGTAPPRLDHTSADDGHRLTLGAGAHQMTLRILDAGPIPEVHVRRSA
ncbi:MAG: hypothetical protein GVY18_15475 [Bacteroidetes bacterium]|jgi:hypothetical protein|nr:hypothetical protein [Bacteroidota bacterium]